MTYVIKHFIRVTASVAISIGAFLTCMFALSKTPALESFAWYSFPISIGAGVLALIRWYARDAYPIGLAYCLGMFFVLRFIGEQVRPFLWK